MSGFRPWGSLAPAWARCSSAFVAALLSVGCGDDGGIIVPPPAGEATELVKISGDAQVWYLNNALPAPYRVGARDANGLPVSGVSVNWAVTSGGGSVSPLVTVTDSVGTATATHSLGPTVGSQAASASATGLAAVEFGATAATPPPSGAVSVGNDFFSPQNVVVRVNGTITWTWNSGGTEHNVIYTSGPTPLPASSPTQDSGTFASTLSSVGRYQYVCTIHAGMEGTVTVVQ